jgi:hypothetical protein
MAAKKPLVIDFEQDKETKGTIRYAEQDTEHVGFIYLKKKAASDLGNPQRLQVTVAPS